MKTAVIYYSKHHGNTKKILDAMAKSGDITFINAADGVNTSLEEYDLIGFASGIYMSRFHKSVISAAKDYLPLDKKVFFVYTCGSENDKYTKAIKQITELKGCKEVGTFSCLGYDTFGPFKLVGGIAKGHPDRTDLKNAAKFFKKINK